MSKICLLLVSALLVTACTKKGAQGSQGVQGPQGVQGQQGVQGDQGPPGPDPAIACSTDRVLTRVAGQWQCVWPVAASFRMVRACASLVCNDILERCLLAPTPNPAAPRNDAVKVTCPAGWRLFDIGCSATQTDTMTFTTVIGSTDARLSDPYGGSAGAWASGSCVYSGFLSMRATEQLCATGTCVPVAGIPVTDSCSFAAGTCPTQEWP